jgi:hypothetical protein
VTAPTENLRDWVLTAERSELHDQWALLCFLGGRSVTFNESDLNAALRRSELLLATGGDPHRPLELYGRAVTALANDLDDAKAREQLATGLEALAPDIRGLRGAEEALRLLGSDRDLAWQCYAMALLADELADEE